MDLRGFKILVTGGAGFIGSHVVDRLLEMGNEVIVYDNLDPFYDPTEKERNIASHIRDGNFKFVNADILNYKVLKAVMRDVDLVIHEAAQPGVRYSIQNPEKAHYVNATGTLCLLKAAKELNVKKIVYASSSSVYGVPKCLPLDEGHPTNPNSPYAASKLAAEKYCEVFHEVYGLNVVILRYFSVYGPRMRPDLAIRAFTERIIREEPPIIYGDGSQSRDWTYIDDDVEATLLAAANDDTAGDVFNIGCGTRMTINELVMLIAKLLGKEGEVKPLYKDAYRGDFPHTQADASKAKRMLGWSPKVSVVKGLQKFMNWYLKRSSLNE